MEAISIPDHTEDSLAFLDKTGRNLFSGDELVTRYQILNGSVQRFAGNMQKLAARLGDFDRICGGSQLFDAVYVERYLKKCRIHSLWT